MVAGYATSSATNVPVTVHHIYARTGTFTLDIPQGCSVSNVTWRLQSHDSSTGTSGQYNINTGEWTSVSSTLSQTTVTSSSNYYLIPGTYDVTVSFTLTQGASSQSVSRTGTVSLTKGKINNISAGLGAQYELSLSPSETTIDAGNTATYSVSLRTYYRMGNNNVASFDTSVSRGSCTWSSSNTGVATVNAGVATGVAGGNTTITARYTPSGGSQVSASATLHVNDVISRSLKVAWASHTGVIDNSVYQEVPARGNIYVGGHATLEARLYTTLNGVTTYQVVPYNNVTWSFPYSLDANFVSIGSNGQVTGLATGNNIYINATATVGGETYTMGSGSADQQARISVVANEIVSYANPVLSLVYSPNPIGVSGGTATPTLTYTQTVTYASGDTGQVNGTITSGATYSGSATGFTLASNGNVTAASNMGSESVTYGNPSVTLNYTGSPIAYTGGTASATVTYSQVKTTSRSSTNTRSISVSVSATVNGKTGSASASVSQSADSGAAATTETLTSGGSVSYSGSATGFSVNTSSGLVTAQSNAGTTTTTYGNPSVTLAYNPNSFGASGGTAVPTVTYSQTRTETRLSTSQRSVTVTATVQMNGRSGTAQRSVTQGADAGSSTNTTLTSGGTLTYSMASATGFTLNASNGNITVAQNNTASARNTNAWVSVSMNGKSASSSHVLISQEAGTVTEYRYRFVVLPDGYRLGVGATRSFYVHRFTDTYVNGSLVQQGTVSTLMSNSDFTWSKVAGTSYITLGSDGSVTGVSAGTSVVRATLKSTVSEYSRYSNTEDDATVYVVSGSWNDDWTVPGTGGDIPMN